MLSYELHRLNIIRCLCDMAVSFSVILLEIVTDSMPLTSGGSGRNTRRVP